MSARGATGSEFDGELVTAIAKLGVARPRVSVAEVEDIERAGSTGKLRRFIALPRTARLA